MFDEVLALIFFIILIFHLLHTIVTKLFFRNPNTFTQLPIQTREEQNQLNQTQFGNQETKQQQQPILKEKPTEENINIEHEEQKNEQDPFQDKRKYGTNVEEIPYFSEVEAPVEEYSPIESLDKNMSLPQPNHIRQREITFSKNQRQITEENTPNEIQTFPPQNSVVSEFSLDLTHDEKTLYQRIKQIFRLHKHLEYKAFLDSEYSKNTVSEIQHNRVVKLLKNDLERIKKLLKTSEEKLEHEKRQFEKKANQFQSINSQSNMKINELSRSLENIKKQKERIEKDFEFRSKKIIKKQSSSNIQPQKSEGKNIQASINNEELLTENENLKGQLEFCQKQLLQAYQSESYLKEKVQRLEKTHDMGHQLSKLRDKIASLQPLADNYQIMEKRYFEMKGKLIETERRYPHVNASNSPLNASLRGDSTKRSRSGISDSPGNRKTATIHYYRFLSDCSFVDLGARQFVYGELHRLLRGVLKTELLFNSQKQHSKNLHHCVDQVMNILLLIELQNDKILGAFTHEAFSPQIEHASSKNIGFIFDVTNRKAFINNAGENSIVYNRDCLCWGLNEIMIKVEEPEILYTNFCRKHNTYWDGKYTIEDFIGTNKQWTRIKQFSIYKIVKI